MISLKLLKEGTRKKETAQNVWEKERGISPSEETAFASCVL